jgi:hypothetical protein
MPTTNTTHSSSSSSSPKSKQPSMLPLWHPCGTSKRSRPVPWAGMCNNSSQAAQRHLRQARPSVLQPCRQPCLLNRTNSNKHRSSKQRNSSSCSCNQDPMQHI